MKKQFIFNIFLLVFFNALIKPFWVFGIDRTVQNIVGSEAYGLYFALFNFSILFNTFLDLGITNFNNRSIAQNQGLIHIYLPRLIVLKIFLGIVYLIICLGMAFFLGYSSNAVKLIGLLAINQFLASMLLFLRSNISGLQLFTTDSILSILDRLIMIVFCSLLLWTNIFPVKINIQVFAVIQTLAYFLSCVVAAGIVLRKTGVISFKGILTPGALLRKSMPYALLGLLMVVYNRIDAVFLERLLPNGAKAAGIYAQSFRFFDAITMISVLFASLLLPMFAKLIARKESIKPLINLAFSILFTGTVILAIDLIVFAKPILDVMYKELYPESVQVFILLMLSIIPVSLTYIFGSLLTADGRLYDLNIFAGFTLVVNVSLNLVLIPEFGVVGAALTALISQILAALFQVFVCIKRYNINMNLHKGGIYFLLFSISTLLALLFNYINMGVLPKLILTLLISAGFAFPLKIINLRELVNTFKAESP